MSRIHDALKKLEAERAGKNGNERPRAMAPGPTAPTGRTATDERPGNGHGNGANGKGRRGWQWLFPGVTRAKRNGGHDGGELRRSGPKSRRPTSASARASWRLPARLPTDQPKLLGCGGLATRRGHHHDGGGVRVDPGPAAWRPGRRRGMQPADAVVRDGLRCAAGAGSCGAGRGQGVARRGRAADAVSRTCSRSARAILGAARPPCSTRRACRACSTSCAIAFDFVILDLPPVNVYGDALIIGPRLDAAVIVIEADATRVPEVERARRTLERSGVRFVGSVLNRRRNYIPAFLEEML